MYAQTENRQGNQLKSAKNKFHKIKQEDRFSQHSEKKLFDRKNRLLPDQYKTRLLSNPVFQLNGPKEAREKEVKELLKKGNSDIGSDIGIFRPYLGEGEERFKFLVGLIGGGFNFSSLKAYLNKINDERHKQNSYLQQDITDSFEKVISFKNNFTAVIGEERDEFRNGRIAEFQGLAGELNAASQLIKTGSVVNRLGQTFRYGDRKNQEVDLVATDGNQSYFIEVAATPSKLRDKIEGGIRGTYPQMQGYQDLASEHEHTRVAYSCPTLAIDQISDELIEKIRSAGVLLVVRGTFHDADSLQNIVDEDRTTIREPKKKSTKSYKQTERHDRKDRIRDRGIKPSSKDILRDALRDYADESEEL